MDREKALTSKSSVELFQQIKELHKDLDMAFMSEFDRSLPFNEELFDRWDRAKKLGFGEGSSIYDSTLVFGKVIMGNHCWIGPNTIIDGSGGLTIGDYCTISSGVQIYTHDNIKQTLSAGKLPIERSAVSIGNRVYIAPNVLITRGIKVGKNCVLGAYSLINQDVPDNTIVFGQPGKAVGEVIISPEGEISFSYHRNKD